MTAIFYSDVVTRSTNGRYELDARSPHNGTIPHADGRAASPNEFGFQYRQHQSEFRYRLTELASGRIVWERWQPRGEDSPHELIVGNDGWSIVRTHGSRPDVLAIRPDGATRMHIRIDPPWPNPNRREAMHRSGEQAWVAERMADTSAGYYWSGHSWRYFATVNGRRYFVWRTSWGSRLVLDLKAETILDPDPQLCRQFDRAEAKGALRLLKWFSTRMDDIKPWLQRANQDESNRTMTYDEFGEAIRAVTAALNLAGVHRIRDAIPHLRAWEELDVRGGMSSIRSLDSQWWLGQQIFRPIVKHSLRCLGEVPAAFPAYSFIEDWEKPAMRVPPTVTKREKKLAAIQRPMSGEHVLKLVGTPDHFSRAVVSEVFLEQWEYDTFHHGRWHTKIVQWDCEGRQPQLAAVVDAAADRAISDDRRGDILDF